MDPVIPLIVLVLLVVATCIRREQFFDILDRLRMTVREIWEWFDT